MVFPCQSRGQVVNIWGFFSLIQHSLLLYIGMWTCPGETLDLTKIFLSVLWKRINYTLILIFICRSQINVVSVWWYFILILHFIWLYMASLICPGETLILAWIILSVLWNMINCGLVMAFICQSQRLEIDVWWYF